MTKENWKKCVGCGKRNIPPDSPRTTCCTSCEITEDIDREILKDLLDYAANRQKKS